MAISIPRPIFDDIRYFESQVFPKTTYANNFKMAQQFLIAYKGSQDTFKTYRREVERLLQWSWSVKNKSITKLKRTDIEEYLEFCQKPPKRWIGFSRPTRFVTKDDQRIPNPKWRPFVVSQSKTNRKKGEELTKDSFCFSHGAMKSLLLVLSTFYNFLISEDYIEHNPILKLRQKSRFIRKSQNQATIRRLSELQSQYLFKTAIQLANDQDYLHERNLFVISLMFLAYIRISELVVRPTHSPKMCDFFRDSSGRWWYRVIGKGNKERKIAVGSDLLGSLMRWRNILSLPSLPSPTDKTPLLPKSKGQGGITNSAHLRSQIQACFDHAIEALRSDNQREEADLLENATPHWLRHTGISMDVEDGRPISHIKDDAGHADIQTTSHYIDADSTARHESAANKKLPAYAVDSTNHKM